MTGTVVEVQRPRSRIKRTSKNTKAVVTFRVGESDYNFESRWSQYPSNYAENQPVEVLYDPQKPENARINSFLELWGSTAFALAFGAVSLFIWLSARLKLLRIHRLKQSGAAIDAQIVEVQLIESLRSVRTHHQRKKRLAWVIVVTARNPVSGDIQLFFSQRLSFDPSPRLDGQKVRVWVDRQDPTAYWVDTSVLTGNEP